jgi:predicted TIM-barrel fold metal-dependent hydrolase
MNGWTWRIVLEPGTYDHDQLVTSLENTVKKHPGTQFVACHLMNLDYDLDRLGQMFDRYPNLNADIAARFSETATIPRYMHRFLTKYSDRIVYGTDVDYDETFFRGTFRILETEDEHFYLRGKMGSANFNFNYHWPSYGFGLPDDVLKKIYRDNMVNIMARAQRRSA